jgi:hypothetical protein
MNIKIITVHGTFANQPSDHGEAWWQKDSAFIRAVSERLQNTLTIIPFHWSGRNNELDRRAAGDELFHLISREIKADSSPIVLIAHSHGGNVVAFALDNFPYREREALEEPMHVRQLTKEWFHEKYVNMRTAASAGRIAGWITVGTPFIRFAPRSRFRDLAHLSTTIRYSIVGILLVALGLLMRRSTVSVALLAVGFAAFFGAFMYIISMSSPRVSPSMNRGKSAGLLLNRWLGISSQLDEAFWSLQTVVTQSIRIPGRVIADSLAISATFFIDTAFLAGMVYACATNPAVLGSIFGSRQFALTVSEILAAAMIALAYVGALLLVRPMVRRLIEPMCGDFLTRTFANVAKGAAFGVEVGSILPIGVERMPQRAPRECSMLDEAADERILMGIRPDREAFITSVYGLIGEGREMSALVDVAFRDPLLVHNRYFGEETVIAKVVKFIEESAERSPLSGLEGYAAQRHQDYIKR